MRIWFDSEGTHGVKKPRFFAVVEEVMIDKNGRAVAAAVKPAEPAEPTPAPAPVVTEPAKAVEPVVVVADNTANEERFDSLEKQVSEVNEKVDMLLTSLEEAKARAEEEKAAVVEEHTEEPVKFEEMAEEVPEEEHFEEPTEETVEEPVEEQAEESAEEEQAEEDNTLEELASETVEEEVVAEEEQPEETFEPVEETSEEAVTEDTTLQDLAAGVMDDDIAASSAVAFDLNAEAGELPEKKGYVRSPNFAEKMMVASEVIQDRYDELKNYALRFRKLKSRISKKFDSINMGRFHFVKLSVAGKTLKLYLNMDINTVDPKFRCVDMSNKKTYVTVPVMLRIKSGRAMKYAKRLIDQCAEQHEMLERRKPFEVDAMQLIEEALNNNNDLPENELEPLDIEEGTEE